MGGGGMTSNLTRYLLFTRKPVNVDVLRPAVPKIALVPASCYYCDINYYNVCAKFSYD